MPYLFIIDIELCPNEHANMILVTIRGVESRSGIHRGWETLCETAQTTCSYGPGATCREQISRITQSVLTACHLRLPGAVAELVVCLGDSRLYESVSVLSASKRDWLDRQRYRRDYRLRSPQSNPRVVLSFCSSFHRFIFLLTTSSHVFRTSFGATASAEPLPCVPMV